MYSWECYMESEADVAVFPLYRIIIVVSYWSCFYSSVMHVILSLFSRSISICQEHQDLSDGRHQYWIQASQINLLCLTSQTSIWPILTRQDAKCAYFRFWKAMTSYKYQGQLVSRNTNFNDCRHPMTRALTVMNSQWFTAWEGAFC